jgi:putative membrane protein
MQSSRASTSHTASPAKTAADNDQEVAGETEPHGATPDPRVTLANERTFLAWNRTALALIAGGLAVSQLVKRGSSSVELVAALALIAFGALTALAGYQHWRRNEEVLRQGKPVDSSQLIRFLAYGIAAFAMTATALAVIRLV